MASPEHTQSHPTRQNTSLMPILIILGSVLAILLIIGVMLAMTQDDDPTILYVPDSDWLPRGDDFTPEFTLTGLESEAAVSLADFRGQYVLINFWATWCPPCDREMPDLQAYHNAHRDHNFTVLAVNVQEEVEVVATYIAARGLDFPVVLDESGEIYARYGGNGLPSSYLIDPRGKVVKAWRPGALTQETLAGDITPLLGG